ncbi:MAG TPA: phosphoribosylglycinamide synthetase C domain-containing protein, partial [Kineosporiaceae bacterium]|nr:phosphoribosylglycinamide synthetase C domain-containing protein [Kineosporiaceae bacterium]
WRRGAAVTVVVAAQGYPASPASGDAVEGLDDAAAVPGAWVLHAGTEVDAEGRVMTSGGRVLSVVGTGEDLAAARAAAYEAVGSIRLRGGRHRTDIADPARMPAVPAPVRG